MTILGKVIEQHAEDASFLWLLRDAAVRSPHYDLDDLVKLDNRVSAHIDGLVIAGDHGWKTCAAALELAEAAEVFTAGVLAIESKDDERLRQVFATAEAEPSSVRGLVSAFGWASAESLRGTVRGLLSSPVSFRRRVGIAACAVHRVDPGNALREAIVDGDEALQSRALRTVGELGRTDLDAALQTQFHAEDAACRFWAAWSAVMTGNRHGAMEVLSFAATTERSFCTNAMQVLLRVLKPEDARHWLKAFYAKVDSLRDVLIGIGVAGDPSYVPWLITHMDSPEMARVAGESFSMISGVDLAYDDLEGERPDGFEAGPTEDPEDDAVALDPDEGLPWPDSQRIQKWWDANKGGFVAGQRYLVGKPVSAEQCQRVLRTGYQRQRNAAALELALMTPAAPLYETRAAGFRQHQQLKA
jgi:uncharacterized protein (TIGR02270 family)